MNSGEIKILFSMNSHLYSKKTQKNAKLIDICINFANERNLDFNSIIFLYGGERLSTDMNETIEQRANNDDKQRNEMIILVYNISEGTIIHNPSNKIKINFLFNSEQIGNFEANKNEKMKDICEKISTNIKVPFDYLIFIYNSDKIDYEKTFEDIANNYDKQCQGITILVYLKEIATITVEFILKNNISSNSQRSKTEQFSKFENIKIACMKYAKSNNLPFNNLIFMYNNKKLDLEEHFLIYLYLCL